MSRAFALVLLSLVFGLLIFGCAGQVSMGAPPLPAPPAGVSCSSYSSETCPASCVVCPPCAECSSISCNTEQFCKSIGFNRSWYEGIKQNLAAAQQNTSASESAKMKTIGMIGGVSWYSTAEYYRIMNERVNDELGDPHSAKILLYSVDFAEFSPDVDSWNFASLRKKLVGAAQRLKAGGAGFIIIGSNTMHVGAEEIRSSTGIPVLHIADATGEKINEMGIRKVALLGSKIVMEGGFYKEILEKRHNLTVILPNETERDYLNKIIFGELCVGEFKNETRDSVVGIINRLAAEEGAQGAILGCTELPLLVKQEDVEVPVFDTTTIHANAAVDYALGKGS